MPLRNSLLFFFLAAAFVVSVALGAYHFFSAQLVSNEQQNLLGMAKVKSAQIEGLLNERQGDARFFVALPSVKRLLSGAGGRDALPEVEEAIAATVENDGYRRVLVFDRQLTLSAASGERRLTESLRESLQKAIAGRQFVLADLHATGDNEYVYGVIYPVFASGDASGAVLGAVYLERSADQTLFPTLENWPTPSASAESLLVRRDGNEIVYLSRLRFKPDVPPLGFRLPLDGRHTLAARALSGEIGLLADEDYRGVAVVGASSAVAGTPWVMITKIDRVEIEQLARLAAGGIFVLAFLMLVLVAGISWLIWRRRLLAIEAERSHLYERYSMALQTSIDGYLMIDESGRIIEINEALCRMTGFAAAELLSFRVKNLEAERSDREIAEQMARIKRAGSDRFVTQWRRKDGQQIGVKISSSFVSDHFFTFVQDISEQLAFERSLSDSRATLQSVVETALDAVVRMDAEGRIVGWNPQARRVFGWASEEVLGRNLGDVIIPPQYREAHQLGLTRFLATGKAHMLNTRIENEGLHRSGRVFPIELSIAQIKRADVVEFSAFIRDISTRREQEAAQRLAATVFNTVDEGIVVTDSSNRIIAINPAFSAITGYAFAEVAGKDPGLLSAGSHPEAFYSAVWASLKTAGVWHGEIENRRKNGEFYISWLSIKRVSDRNGETTHYVAAFSDISERKKQESLVRHMAQHDALTDLPNRALFADRLQQALSRAQRDGGRLALLFLDLDRFKPVNDTLGHQTGDQLLKDVARRLLGCVRESDTVARIGGDEFIVLLSDIDAAADALAVGEKVRNALNQPFQVADHILSISSSVGIAIYPEHGSGEIELTRHADIAMYWAKHHGRDVVRCFDVSLLETK